MCELVPLSGLLFPVLLNFAFDIVQPFCWYVRRSWRLRLRFSYSSVRLQYISRPTFTLGKLTADVLRNDGLEKSSNERHPNSERRKTNPILPGRIIILYCFGKVSYVFMRLLREHRDGRKRKTVDFHSDRKTI